MPKASIIIPVYNASQFLAKCIESIIAQTESDIEVLLINDGSRDDSLEICREYAQKDPRIKVFDKPNGGVSSTRNHGIGHAQGEYVMFVDADDWLSPDAVEKCIPYMPQYDIIRFSAYAVYPHKMRKYRLGKNGGLKKVISSIISRKTIVACWGALFRRDLFTRNGIRFDESLNIGEDWLVTAQTAMTCRGIKMLPDCFGYYYNKTNLTSCTLNMGKSKIMKQFEALNKIRQIVPEGYESEFSYTKCLFIQELIDNCGMSEAARELEQKGVKLTTGDILNILIANISIRKKFSLLRFRLGYHND